MEKLEPLCIASVNINEAAAMETNLVPQNLNTELSYDPAILHLGMYPKE